LISFSQLALVGFGASGRPWNVFFIFLNGLPLGMVFGLVLGFLEGRQTTELLAAGLCTSFILADGVMKSVGQTLITPFGEAWMPAVAGSVFILPLLFFVWMLAQIPRPSHADESQRQIRTVMSQSDRWAYSLLKFIVYMRGWCVVDDLCMFLTISTDVGSADVHGSGWFGSIYALRRNPYNRVGTFHRAYARERESGISHGAS